MKCSAVHDMTFRRGHAQPSSAVAEHAVAVAPSRAGTDLHVSGEAHRPAGAKRPPRRFNKRSNQDVTDEESTTAALQHLIRPSISGSTNPEAEARRLLSDCRTPSDLLCTLQFLPDSCRCGYVSTVAFSVARQLHEKDQPQTVSRKQLKKHRHLLVVLDDLGCSSFHSLTLSQCTTVAAAIASLRPPDTHLRTCVHVLLDTASSRISQAVLLGPEGAAAAADTACALLGMLANCSSLVDQQTSKDIIQQACAVIRDAAASLAPAGIASTMAALGMLSTPRIALDETREVLLDRISFLQQHTVLAPCEAAALASACAHTDPPQIALAGRLIDSITATAPVSEQPLVNVVVPLAECHAAVWRQAGPTAMQGALNSRSPAAAAAREAAGLLCMRAQELPSQLSPRVLRAFGTLPVSAATRRAFVRALLGIPAGDSDTQAAPSATSHSPAAVQRLTGRECVQLLEALYELQLPVGDSTVSAAANTILEQLVYLRPYAATAAAAVSILGKLQLSVVDSDTGARNISMLCARVRNAHNPPPPPSVLLTTLQGLAGIQTSWQSSLSSRSSADILGSLIPELGTVQPEALAELTAAVGALDLSTPARATFLVALEATLTEYEFQGMSAHAAMRLLCGLSGIYTRSTKYHVECGRGTQQFSRIPEPRRMSPQPPSVALDALVQRAAPCIKPHELDAAELATVCDALARLEAPPSVAAPVVYSAVGAAERNVSSLHPDSTVKLVRGLSAFIDVVRVPSVFLSVLDTHVIACMPHMHAQGVVELSHHWPVMPSPGAGNASWIPRRSELMHGAVKRSMDLLPSLQPFKALQLIQAVSRIAKRAAVDLPTRRYRSLKHQGRLGDLTLVGKGILANAVEQYVDERLPFAKAREERYLRLMCSAAGLVSSHEDHRSPRSDNQQDDGRDNHWYKGQEDSRSPRWYKERDFKYSESYSDRDAM